MAHDASVGVHVVRDSQPQRLNPQGLAAADTTLPDLKRFHLKKSQLLF
jgi:hypothetical protein